MQEQGKVVIVTGPIGSGKSTLSQELAAGLGPETLWLPEADEKGQRNPYLADYYEDAKRWALTMQVHLLGVRYRQHLQAQWFTMNTGHDAVLDSCYWQDTAFARLQLQLGLMTEREFDTYAALYRAMTASVLLPSAAVRILATPETCHARITARMEKQTGRKCESSIDLDYVRKLDAEIDGMSKVLRDMGCPIFDVPWDAERDSAEAREQTIASLAGRIRSLSVPDPFLDTHRRTL